MIMNKLDIFVVHLDQLWGYDFVLYNLLTLVLD